MAPDPQRVRVGGDKGGRALQCRRRPFRFLRDDGQAAFADAVYWQHICLYVLRRSFLLDYAKMAPTPIERYENLEQLRVLEHGYAMAVVDAAAPCIGVDTPEDLERAQEALEAQSLK